ncbi:hypothetical protein [Amycolatopsis saalfeldensis]|uniref:Uncharacterized protein n=1 Tax=Amycolatopsis saalfeldensis TaxID=394193 RepID=A0A1H8XLR0_9PSEU|nr:hypothetical protein [Amycolatopsis saalfeldensis]SEP41014.1 hypothetical protein SAMN04489732_10879 [Amycolatopsis saalfeldensis]
MGGLVGGLVDVVGTTLNTALHTVGGVIGTVGSVGQTVLPPSVPGGSADQPPLLPIDGVLGPVFSGGAVSGGVTATVPTLVGATVAPAGVTVPAATAPPAGAPTTTTVASRGGLTETAIGHADSARAQRQQQRESDTHAINGGGGSGGGGGGLPAAPSAPMAPTTTATPGHDNSGGARQAFAVSGDSATTTQLKLIGVSRDHEVDGAGREAALPTTSPD